MGTGEAVICSSVTGGTGLKRALMISEQALGGAGLGVAEDAEHLLAPLNATFLRGVLNALGGGAETEPTMPADPTCERLEEALAGDVPPA